jgi:hypothetical protein
MESCPGNFLLVRGLDDSGLKRLDQVRGTLLTATTVRTPQMGYVAIEPQKKIVTVNGRAVTNSAFAGAVRGGPDVGIGP